MTNANYDYALQWVQRTVEHGPMPVGVFGAATSTGVQEIAAFGADDGRRAAVDDQVPLEQLLSPRSGLADPDLDSADPRTQLENAHLIFPPGTMTQYCNIGFVA